MIAVMGAAGNVGSKVVDLLLEGGEEVRALQHGRDLMTLTERGVEVVKGDATNREDLEAFFEGAVAALVLLPENVADPDFVEHRRVMSAAIRDALRGSRIGHVVALSFLGAALEDAPGPAGGLHGFERDLAELDTDVLVLRSAGYMDYLLAALPMIEAEKVNGSAIGADARFPMVATRDVAREAADRLRRRDFSGHEVQLLLGPQDITMAQATRGDRRQAGDAGPPLRPVPARRREGGADRSGDVGGGGRPRRGHAARRERWPVLRGRPTRHRRRRRGSRTSSRPRSRDDHAADRVSTIEDRGIDARAMESLRARFRGALLRSGEEGYEEARRVWNGAIVRPALIARCAGADDVVEALRFARERELLVSVRGGGHSVAGHAVCDGGLMIDLSLMKSIEVDPEARVARAAGGVLWGELDRATQGFGLATTGGIISHTGIGGLTLGGGLGHLMRKFGFTVDNLRSVDLVTADGERLHVDDRTEPDLLWGLRGGGGNFGVATAFEYDLHPVGPMVLGGPIVWPLEDAPEALRFVNDFAAEAPDDLGMTIAARLAPPMPILPADRYGTPVVMLLLVWAGDPAEGREGDRPVARARHADR